MSAKKALIISRHRPVWARWCHWIRRRAHQGSADMAQRAWDDVIAVCPSVVAAAAADSHVRVHWMGHAGSAAENHQADLACCTVAACAVRLQRRNLGESFDATSWAVEDFRSHSQGGACEVSCEEAWRGSLVVAWARQDSCRRAAGPSLGLPWQD